ncbi:MAG: VanZ family protein, partial [Deltaproteobacteria bacterium]|nr:VanZ family protein [Deltaproteobacteria bacterium]
MRILFSILSIAYIASIFLLVGSSIVSYLSVFNPYSLLHIPLYGILALLIVFSFVPFKFNYFKQGKSYIQRFNNPMTHLPNNLMPRFIIAGFIALIVAIADEIYQAYLPNRNASATDVLLDLAGIALVLFLIHRLYNKIIPNDL